MRNIACLIGPYLSGAEDIIDEVVEYMEYTKVLPVTTRPMKRREEDNKDYIFLNERTFRLLRDDNKFLSIRDYITWNGEIFRYAFFKSIFEQKNVFDYVLLTDLKGFKDILEEYPDDKVMGIYIDVPRDSLIERYRENGISEEEIELRLHKQEEEYASADDNIKDELRHIANVNLEVATRKVLDILCEDCIYYLERMARNSREEIFKGAF